MSDQATQQARDRENEALGMAEAARHMDEIQRKYPDWYAMYDLVMPDSLASRSEMAELWATAPTPWAQALIYGKFTIRQEIAAHTGIPFV
ncbi:MAG: hypothetical protein JSS14_22550 [Proteobacteria bacterium]|nr:hypothetical protein [Pseudomonadota bacterium]